MDIEIMRAKSKLIDKIVRCVKTAERYDEYKVNGLLEVLKCLDVLADEIMSETVEALRGLEEKYNVRLMFVRSGFELSLSNGTYSKISEYQQKEYQE